MTIEHKATNGEAEHRKTTTAEAGHKGGKSRAEKYSKKELSDQAKQAAQTIESKEPGFHAEIGQKGGTIRAEKYSKEELSEQAKRAAQTIEREHPGFHAEIGKKGGKARRNKNEEIKIKNTEMKEHTT